MVKIIMDRSEVYTSNRSMVSFTKQTSQNYILFKFKFLLRKRLFTGTVPVNKEHLTGIVPVNKEQLTGTVPVNKEHLTGTLKK